MKNEIKLNPINISKKSIKEDLQKAKKDSFYPHIIFDFPRVGEYFSMLEKAAEDLNMKTIFIFENLKVRCCFYW